MLTLQTTVFNNLQQLYPRCSVLSTDNSVQKSAVDVPPLQQAVYRTQCSEICSRCTHVAACCPQATVFRILQQINPCCSMLSTDKCSEISCRCTPVAASGLQETVFRNLQQKYPHCSALSTDNSIQKCAVNVPPLQHAVYRQVFRNLQQMYPCCSTLFSAPNILTDWVRCSASLKSTVVSGLTLAYIIPQFTGLFTGMIQLTSHTDLLKMQAVMNTLLTTVNIHLHPPTISVFYKSQLITITILLKKNILGSNCQCYHPTP